jgi:hypothetical protein
VRIRRRKPWVLARRRLFGWKVRLLTRCLRCCQADGGRLPACGVRALGSRRGVRVPASGAIGNPERATSTRPTRRHGQAKATENRPSPRYGSVEERVKLARPLGCQISRTARRPVNARRNPPVSGPPWLASGRHAELSTNSLHSAPPKVENAVAELLASRLTAGSVHRVWTTCGQSSARARVGSGRSAHYV